jgi:hypothetical protein
MLLRGSDSQLDACNSADAVQVAKLARKSNINPTKKDER